MATLSAKEVAREFGTDARTFRKFMRDILPREEQPGQGNRYNIEESDVQKLREQFKEWHKPRTKLSPNGAEADTDEDEEIEDAGDDVDLDLTLDDVEEPDEDEFVDLDEVEDLEEIE